MQVIKTIMTFINNRPNEITIPERVEKKWGYEDVIINTDSFCGKILKFNKGAKFSNHFHDKKEEYFYCDSGVMQLTITNTSNATKTVHILLPGNGMYIPRLCPHQVECLEEGRIFEFSTTHMDSDSYRIEPGDSQK